MEAEPSLLGGLAISFDSVWISTIDASISRTTGSLRCVSTLFQTLARTSANAGASSERAVPFSSWNVRNTVVSDETEPNRSHCARRCSMSLQLSPPPASTSAIWTRPCPGHATASARLEGRRVPTVVATGRS